MTSELHDPAHLDTAHIEPEPIVLTLSCPDRPGIVHRVTGLIAQCGGNITASSQYGQAAEVNAAGTDAESLQEARFFMRVAADVPGRVEDLRAKFTPLAEELAMDWRIDVAGEPVRTVLMASKDAHCLSDLLHRHRTQGLNVAPVAVVSNHRDLEPLARFYDVPFRHIPVSRATKAEAEAALLDLLREENVELVVLARYMQILSDDLCAALEADDIAAINIHHSFLPSFKGARPYAQAHARGVKLTGATAHYVTADLDEGPIIEQDVERCAHDDTVEQLIASGQDVERRVLSRAVRWHSEHRILKNGRRTVVFD